MADPSTATTKNGIAPNTLLSLLLERAPFVVFCLRDDTQAQHISFRYAFLGVGIETKQTSGDVGKSNFLEVRKVEVRKTPLVRCWMSAPRGVVVAGCTVCHHYSGGNLHRQKRQRSAWDLRDLSGGAP
jgi:hypothetical protein